MLLRRPMSVATLEIVADITWVSTEFLSQTAETCPARCCIYFSRPSYPNVVNFSVVFHNIIRRWTNHSAPRQSCSQSESPGPGLCDDSWQSRVHTKPPTSTQQYVVPGVDLSPAAWQLLTEAGAKLCWAPGRAAPRPAHPAPVLLCEGRAICHTQSEWHIMWTHSGQHGSCFTPSPDQIQLKRLTFCCDGGYAHSGS